MTDLIAPFDLVRVVTEPWSAVYRETTFWIVLQASLVGISCALVGNFLILRRLALVGDAISHSVLPGIVVAFLIGHGDGPLVMFGAMLAGMLTTLGIEWIHKNSRIKQDAAIGIVFTTLFAIGVILVSLTAHDVHIDAECILYGKLEQAAVFSADSAISPQVIPASAVAMLSLLLVALFYKQLLVSAFDPTLAGSLGIPASWVHYGLMAWLSVVVVSAFQAVGSIMVVAMLIVPGATAMLLSTRLPRVMVLSALHAVMSSLAGYHLAMWLNCNASAAIIVTGMGFFCLAWMFSPSQGIVSQLLVRKMLRERLARSGARRSGAV